MSRKKFRPSDSEGKPHIEHLKSKWLKRHQKLKEKLWKKHGHSLMWIYKSTHNLMVGGTASLLMLSHPVASTLMKQGLPIFNDQNKTQVEEKTSHTSQQLVTSLAGLLPNAVQPLSQEQEFAVANLLTTYFRVPISAELQGIRLNRSYGYIGLEQHLSRYTGDTVGTHFDSDDEVQRFAASGMAPGRGAWGYFADSAETLTSADKQSEKYYIAAQTFLAPGWLERTHKLYDFFKYRKMIVVNPDNGKAIVVVIGDAGPAEFTGKHLGGSPEVMSYLKREDGVRKNGVLYFFIDDPDNNVPLGPIQVQ